MANTTNTLAKQIDELGGLLESAKNNIEKCVIGQPKVVELSLTALLSGGHALLVGAPGLAKTRLVETLGTVMGLDSNRVQFTPDLMPADILGSEILDIAEDGKRAFRFVEGPIFCQLLMADEINRASPRTQSALLQAMQEREVSIAGQTRKMAEPFHVLATQNPIEQEGTYPLPEAQLDRFILQIDVGFPDRDTEREILLATTGFDEAVADQVFKPEQLIAAQEIVRRMPVGESVVEAILDLVRSARPEETSDTFIQEAIGWGPGPRAAQALMLATRARALIQGRLAPSLDDVEALAHPALVHRMALNFSAKAQGETLDRIIASLAGKALGKEAAA
ncbi:MoxR family ATPase [Amylibacter sp. SFDW26]|uniref:AAA family ATPase n=1 Tax=Amylibacter sp. SFDW26 TaxID=2652722 RepID=UPI00126150B4|nr:MoxR family ATPase [Amylibacter sp. SFDW26]KAB7613878.1 MoxR family ATPase [Amylibacter sp. SFDW26]